MRPSNVDEMIWLARASEERVGVRTQRVTVLASVGLVARARVKRSGALRVGARRRNARSGERRPLRETLDPLLGGSRRLRRLNQRRSGRCCRGLRSLS